MFAFISYVQYILLFSTAPTKNINELRFNSLYKFKKTRFKKLNIYFQTTKLQKVLKTNLTNFHNIIHKLLTKLGLYNFEQN